MFMCVCVSAFEKDTCFTSLSSFSKSPVRDEWQTNNFMIATDIVTYKQPFIGRSSLVSY